MSLTSLSRETLSDQIAKQLTAFIVTENLQPGDLLPAETKLADEFGVSRPVVREALRSMAAQGAIEVVSGKGAIVRPVDDKLLRVFFRRAIDIGHGSFVELMEIRRPLEVQSAALAADRRTPEEAAVIAKTALAMRSNLDNLDTYAELDVAFHLRIAAASHNQLLYHLISSVRAMLKDVIREGLARRENQEQLERIQTVHHAIANAIKNEDSRDAAAQMALHFDEALEFLSAPPA
jgi:DNA-binding FadR family transcriptional regulator